MDADQVWQTALTELEGQMTRATFDWFQNSHALSFDDGILVIGVKNGAAVANLQERLKSTVNRTVAAILGHPIDLRFEVAPNGGAPTEADGPEPQHPQDMPDELRQQVLTPGEKVAQADYINAFFGRGSPGYGPITHYTSFFWMQFLSDAFLLWKYLDSLDIRKLESIAPNYWSPVYDDFSFSNLAKRLNHQKSGYITGEPRECNFSRICRIERQRPLTSPDDCCWREDYEYIHHKTHPQHPDQIMCMRWAEGLLEKLQHHHLAKIEIPTPAARKPKVQIWRMLPMLTPTQEQFYLSTDTIQEQHKLWIERYGVRFGLDPNQPYQDWKQITEPTLVPLMPGYALAGIIDNYDTRQTYQDFIAAAARNPNYLPCMGDNWTDS